MQLSVNNLKPKNIGQTVSFTYDPNGEGADDPDLVEVMGVLEGVKKRGDEVVLVVAGEEFPLTPEEQVDMIRSTVLSKLYFIECEYLKQQDGEADPED
ncbi:hypothetical protein AUR04nite_00210 [Glutamicibacter uratoxydans]|uniref:Uncharacterized protein n=1 Tax=Glutamicibacter uratoxydans TaxID=43667 RepID=A0A4Y4DGZ3_GLUUR|nr:hypothetical protein [Glutamicibacter uratoxydans]GED04489.1 hypothetical protein AUR04nite_00210 [Glutamicibacter uratoxydans]